MSKDLVIFLSMLGYMALIIVIGLIYSKKNKSTEEFFLGGRGLGPWITAMSAEASDMSGWLLMGLPGVAYLTGFADAGWTAIGLALGTYLNWRLVSVRLRKYSQIAGNAITIPDFFSNRFHDKKKLLMNISALIILVFFSLYVGTGFKACGSLFSSLFGYDYHLMMVISAVVIVLYTVIGGFLAESTTDFIQGLLMFFALIIVLVVGISHAGGISSVTNHASNIDGFSNMFKIHNPETNSADDFGFIKIISTMAWGLGYFGMPHVLLRFMAIRNSKELKKSRIIATVWVVISLLVAVLIGIVGATVFPGVLEGQKSETIFILMSQEFMLPIFAGIMLSGILASTMSTSDSQLLITSSAVSTNFFKGFLYKKATEKQVLWISRITIVIVTIVSVFLAWDEESKIFDLVSYAWAGFGAAFGPLILFSLFWKRTNLPGAVCGMVAGGAMVVFWKEVIRPLGGIFDIYELLPAFLFSGLVIFVVSLATKKPSDEIVKEFESVKTAKI